MNSLLSLSTSLAPVSGCNNTVSGLSGMSKSAGGFDSFLRSLSGAARTTGEVATNTAKRVGRAGGEFSQGRNYAVKARKAAPAMDLARQSAKTVNKYKGKQPGAWGQYRVRNARGNLSKGLKRRDALMQGARAPETMAGHVGAYTGKGIPRLLTSKPGLLAAGTTAGYMNGFGAGGEYGAAQTMSGMEQMPWYQRMAYGAAPQTLGDRALKQKQDSQSFMGRIFGPNYGNIQRQVAQRRTQ